MSLAPRLRRALLPTYQAHARRLHELRYLFLELTRDCNLDCRHCGSACTRETGGPSLAPSAVLRVLREIRDRYDPRTITVAFCGGEPLCYPEVFLLGQAITNLEFPWGMVTNGYGWTSTKVLQARAAGMQSVTVSLDGLEADHDWLRGRSGAFRQAVDAISMLLRDPSWQMFEVVTCVHPRNLSALDRLHGLVRALGVREWRLFTISPMGRAAGDPELLLDRTAVPGAACDHRTPAGTRRHSDQSLGVGLPGPAARMPGARHGVLLPGRSHGRRNHGQRRHPRLSQHRSESAAGEHRHRLVR